MRLYDSTSPETIPSTATIVAGYINGLYAWTPAQFARFTKAIKLTVSIDPTTNADCYDCERGNFTYPQIPTVIRKHGPGKVIYLSRDNWEPAIQAVANAPGPLPQPLWWVADWTTNTPHVLAGSVATQWTSQSHPLYDISTTDGVWPVVPTVLSTTKGVTIMSCAVGTGVIVVTGVSKVNGHKMMFTVPVNGREQSATVSCVDLSDAVSEKVAGATSFVS